jgi:hypothetical protein
MSPVQLAAHFGYDPMTIKRWLARPVGYVPQYGRPKGSGKRSAPQGARFVSRPAGGPGTPGPSEDEADPGYAPDPDFAEAEGDPEVPE